MSQSDLPFPGGCSRLAHLRSRLTIVDLFGIFNSSLFVLLASTMYWQRFLQYKSRANLPEFLIYATALLLGILLAWSALRRLRVNPAVLVLLECGVLLHFLAGLLHPFGLRLYDMPLGVRVLDYPLRFDKLVHLCNAFVGCGIALELFRLLHVRIPRIKMLIVSLTVLGFGAGIEMVEYLVLKTIPHNGVGDYDNNMTDLIGNLAGCLAFTATRRILAALGFGYALFGLSTTEPRSCAAHGHDTPIPHRDPAIASSRELVTVSGEQHGGAS